MAQSNVPTTFVLAPGLLSPSAPQTDGAPKTKQAAFPPPNFLVPPAFPEAHWSLGGALLYDNALVEFLKFVNSEIPALRVRDAFGAPPCTWTLDWYSTRPLVPPGNFSDAVKRILEQKIAFTLDFDNPFIEESMLTDVVGNTLLQSVAKLPKMRVNVASDLLAEHIRKAFPQAEICAGANKVIAENGQGNLEYYVQAAAKFKNVTLHPADAVNPEFLEQLATRISPEQCEIVINDTCLRCCTARKEHLEILAKIRRAPWDAALLQQRHAVLGKVGCENVSATPPNPDFIASILSREEWSRAYALGFRNFKVQAEKLRSEIAFFWELGTWMLSDAPEVWHKKFAFMASAVNNITLPTPVLKTGTRAFVLRKYE